MSSDDTPFTHTLQQEIDELRAQAALLLAGPIRTRLLARATALEVTMKAYALVASPDLQPPQRDTD
jgi:hypothetical protein